MTNTNTSDSNTSERTWLSGPADMLRSAADVFQQDVDGVRQAISHASGSEYKPLNLIDAPKKSSGWTMAGTLVGSVLEFGLANKVIGGVGKAFTPARAVAPMNAWTMGMAGGITESLKPVDQANGGDQFETAKATQFATGFATFAAMGGMSKYLSDSAIFGRIGHRTLGDAILANTTSGTVAGIANVAINDGIDKKLPGIDDLKTVGQFGAFGALFGAFEYKFLKANVQLKSADGGVSRPSTEELVGANYDESRPLKAPFLTWLADTKPHLRPDNYLEWRQANPMGSIDLSAWNPQQRIAVVSELRKIANTSLASDANLDAFLQRFKTMDQGVLANYSAFDRATVDAYTKQDSAYERILDLAQKLAPDTKVEDLLRGVDPRGRTPEFQRTLEDAWKAGEEISRIEGIGPKPPVEKAVESEIGRVWNSVARDMNLPESDVRIDDGNLETLAGWTGRDLVLNRAQFHLPLSATVAGTNVHEFVHNLQGRWGTPLFLRKLAVGPLTNFDYFMHEPMMRSGFIREQRALLTQPGMGKQMLMNLSEGDNLLRESLWAPRTTMSFGPQDFATKNAGAVRSQLPETIQKLIARSKADDSAAFDTEAREELKKDFAERIEYFKEQSVQRLNANYFGSAIERPAQATGILAEIRARELGFPDHQPLSIQYRQARLPFPIWSALQSRRYADLIPRLPGELESTGATDPPVTSPRVSQDV